MWSARDAPLETKNKAKATNVKHLGRPKTNEPDEWDSRKHQNENTKTKTSFFHAHSTFSPLIPVTCMERLKSYLRGIHGEIFSGQNISTGTHYGIFWWVEIQEYISSWEILVWTKKKTSNSSCGRVWWTKNWHRGSLWGIFWWVKKNQQKNRWKSGMRISLWGVFWWTKNKCLLDRCGECFGGLKYLQYGSMGRPVDSESKTHLYMRGLLGNFYSKTRTLNSTFPLHATFVLVDWKSSWDKTMGSSFGGLKCNLTPSMESALED